MGNYFRIIGLGSVKREILFKDTRSVFFYRSSILLKYGRAFEPELWCFLLIFREMNVFAP